MNYDQKLPTHHIANPDELIMWVIYDHPIDYPDCFIAREFIVTNISVATNHIITSPDLEKLRTNFIEEGYTCIPRSSMDELQIVETWL